MSASALSPIAACALVACGGAVGSVARYALGLAVGAITGTTSTYPWAILGINILGSLAMGLLFGWLARHNGGTETIRLLLGVGLLGGFTTFSAFSLEIILLIQREAFGLAALYVGSSVIGGIIALYAGLILMGETA